MAQSQRHSGISEEIKKKSLNSNSKVKTIYELRLSLDLCCHCGITDSALTPSI